MKKVLLALILFIGMTSIVNAEDKTPPCFKDLYSGKNIFKQILGHANHKDYVFPISNGKDLYLEIEIPEDHSHLSHKYSDPNFDEVIYFTNDSAQHEKITIFINRRHKIKNTDYLR